jgi:hypothetical protein
METFSRLLWGITPLLAGGSEPTLSFYLQAIKNGTNPQHADYWGDVGPFDQRIVEMAAYGYCWRWRAKPYWHISLRRRRESMALAKAVRDPGYPR